MKLNIKCDPTFVVIFGCLFAGCDVNLQVAASGLSSSGSGAGISATGQVSGSISSGASSGASVQAISVTASQTALGMSLRTKLTAVGVGSEELTYFMNSLDASLGGDSSSLNLMSVERVLMNSFLSQPSRATHGVSDQGVLLEQMNVALVEWAFDPSVSQVVSLTSDQMAQYVYTLIQDEVGAIVSNSLLTVLSASQMVGNLTTNSSQILNRQVMSNSEWQVLQAQVCEGARDAIQGSNSMSHQTRGRLLDGLPLECSNFSFGWNPR